MYANTILPTIWIDDLARLLIQAGDWEHPKGTSR